MQVQHGFCSILLHELQKIVDITCADVISASESLFLVFVDLSLVSRRFLTLAPSFHTFTYR
ncbi:MAG: hypothetical protein J07HQW1_01382 [Haloquadratum walsbyi J07HQW1]|uniref:Uncharacterized protein n=1 Tax=Haloquadratum walsbyi J07HQW1 TaxID=1238424 RepID=U1N4N1_9EURY|nr:MAG: hypothetical protein J07HQW1_01382 [Haloquadratum walsbyi J07HQW1]